jgi:hypothetical protein
VLCKRDQAAQAAWQVPVAEEADITNIILGTLAVEIFTLLVLVGWNVKEAIRSARKTPTNIGAPFKWE